MPKKFKIIQSQVGPEFLFDCSKCVNATECMNNGYCHYEQPSDGDHEVDDKTPIKEVVSVNGRERITASPGVIKAIKQANDNDHFRNEICGSLSTNFQYQYND